MFVILIYYHWALTFNHLFFCPSQRLTGSPSSGPINVEINCTNPLSNHLKTVMLVLAAIQNSNVPLPSFDNCFFDCRIFSALFKWFRLFVPIAHMPCDFKCLNKSILVKRLSIYSLWPTFLGRFSAKRMATAWNVPSIIDASVTSCWQTWTEKS